MMLYLLPPSGRKSVRSIGAGGSVSRSAHGASRKVSPAAAESYRYLRSRLFLFSGNLNRLPTSSLLSVSLSLSDPLSSSLFLPLTPPSLSLTNTSTHVRSLALPHHPSLPRTPIEDHSTEQHNEQPHALNGRGAVMGGC